MLSPSARWSLRRPLAHHIRLTSNSVLTPRRYPRRGRNLTERYHKLENTRAKSERAGHVAVLELPFDGPVRDRTSTSSNTIAGLVIPQEPRAPADDECCMSGCAVCVYDLYEEALAVYKDSVTTLRAALAARHVPETEWPIHIRTSKTAHATSTTAEISKDAVLDAFEEMERTLEEKRERRATVEAEKRARGDVLTGDGERVGFNPRAVYEAIRWLLYQNR